MPPPQSKTSVPPPIPPPPPITCCPKSCFPLPLSPTRMGRTHCVVVKHFHWSKFVRVAKGSVWDDIQLHDDNQSWVTEVDVSEMKSLFSTLATPLPPQRSKTSTPPISPPPRSRTSDPLTPNSPPRLPQFMTFVPPPTPPPPRFKISPSPPAPPPRNKTYAPLTPPNPPPPPPQYRCFAPRTSLSPPPHPPHPPHPPQPKPSAPTPTRSKTYALPTPPPPPPRSKNSAPPPPIGGRLIRCFSLPMPRLFVVDQRRAFNCEIMLSRIKIPVPDMLSAVLALDSSAVDIDQVNNLIKFCPTKEEMHMLRNYTGDKEKLGKSEQFFMELMKVPRIEAKLRVFGFKITFASQVEELKGCLNTINAATKEVKESTKLRQILQTILALGNALNQGTARGDAVGFRLESLLTISDTRATNNQMNLMHYLCKLVGEKKPELLDFAKDLVHLEAASKIALKTLAEEMQALCKGLEKVEQELMTSENDGAISLGFRKVLKDFLDSAEAEVRPLIPLHSEVGKNADSLSLYFGEDPTRRSFEQVTTILTHFMKTFIKSREENERRAEAEKNKLKIAAMKYKPARKKDTVDSDNKAYLPDSLTQNMKKTELL